jgi:hypothetical protein
MRRRGRAWLTIASKLAIASQLSIASKLAIAKAALQIKLDKVKLSTMRRRKEGRKEGRKEWHGGASCACTKLSEKEMAKALLPNIPIRHYDHVIEEEGN